MRTPGRQYHHPLSIFPQTASIELKPLNQLKFTGTVEREEETHVMRLRTVNRQAEELGIFTRELAEIRGVGGGSGGDCAYCSLFYRTIIL